MTKIRELMRAAKVADDIDALTKLVDNIPENDAADRTYGKILQGDLLRSEKKFDQALLAYDAAATGGGAPGVAVLYGRLECLARLGVNDHVSETAAALLKNNADDNICSRSALVLAQHGYDVEAERFEDIVLPRADQSQHGVIWYRIAKSSLIRGDRARSKHCAAIASATISDPRMANELAMIDYGLVSPPLDSSLLSEVEKKWLRSAAGGTHKKGLGVDFAMSSYFSLPEGVRAQLRARSSPMDDLVAIAHSFRKNSVHNVVEIGGFLGLSALFFAPNISGSVYSINISREETRKAENLMAHFDIENVEFIVGDSLEVLPGLVERLGDSIDAAYIDGLHTYHHSFNEYKLLEPMLEQGPGAVCFFDDAYPHLEGLGDGGVERTCQEVGANILKVHNNRIAVKTFGAYQA